MIEAIVILGKEAVKYYETTGTIPAGQDITGSGGLVLKKQFSTKETYEAYVEALEESDGQVDWRMLPPKEVPEPDFRQRLDTLYRQLSDALGRIKDRPAGWLPHTVYVEEEGEDEHNCGMPVYTRYRLEEIHADTCTLVNPLTGECFQDRRLYEINIDWLQTVWNRYGELKCEQ